MLNVERIKRGLRGKESLSYTFWCISVLGNILGCLIVKIFGMILRSVIHNMNMCVDYGYGCWDLILVYDIGMCLLCLLILIGYFIGISYISGVVLSVAYKYYHENVWAKVILGYSLVGLLGYIPGWYFVLHLHLLEPFEAETFVLSLINLTIAGVTAYRLTKYNGN